MYLDVNKISDIEIMRKSRHLFVEIFIPQLFLPIICLLTIDLSNIVIWPTNYSRKNIIS